MKLNNLKLINEIKSAFKNAKLEDGISLIMTEYRDSGGCMPEYKEKAKYDERDDWSTIPDRTLENFTVTFSFTDFKGFRFYIPAYMIWTINNFDKSDSIIADFTIYAIDPNHYIFEKTSFADWFSQEQLSAMCNFLKFAIEQNGRLDSKVALNNLLNIQRILKNGL